jgi:hypothetical protein
MNKFLRINAVLLLSFLLGACALPGAIKPGTTAEELTQKLGKPTDIRPGSDGGESWEYAYGPEGVQTWRYDLDRGRTVRTATQLLTQEQLYRVIPGTTTEAGVLALLGKPREKVMLAGESVWEWRVAIGPENGVFVVRFGPDGKATGYNVLKDFFSDDRDSGP